MFGFGKKNDRKKSDERIVLLMGNSLRHHYFANRLAERYRVVGVISEISKPHLLAEVTDQHPLMRLLYTSTLEKEVLYFGSSRNLSIEKQHLLMLPYGQVNTSVAHTFIGNRAPDYLVTFDTSPLAQPLIEAYRKKILHLHDGLLNYYNGNNPNLWSIVDRRPECAGMSVHLMENTNDEGPLLGQIRPILAATDDIADVLLKSIVAGVTLIEHCIHAYHIGQLTPQQSPNSGTFHDVRDLTPDKILAAKKAMEEKLIGDFVSRKKELFKQAPILEVL